LELLAAQRIQFNVSISTLNSSLNMNTEILLNVTPTETRMGLVENGVLQEV